MSYSLTSSTPSIDLYRPYHSTETAVGLVCIHNDFIGLVCRSKRRTLLRSLVNCESVTSLWCHGHVEQLTSDDRDFSVAVPHA